MHEKTYMIQIDGLRAFAVGSVIFSHYASFSTLYRFNLWLGDFGVTLFFVLSGYLISRILITAKNDLPASAAKSTLLKPFYIRRFLRIFPLYYLVIALGLLIGISASSYRLGWLLSYTSNWLIAPPAGDLGYFSHTWSLAVEEQFYIFFPLLVLFIPTANLKKLSFWMIGIGVVSRLAVVLAGARINWSNDQISMICQRITPACLDSFGLGLLLAWLTVSEPERLRTFLARKQFRNLFSAIAALTCVLALFSGKIPWLQPLGAITDRLAISLLATLLIGRAAFAGFQGRAGRWLSHRAWVYLGKISYGLYLYHFVVLFFFTKPILSEGHLNLIVTKTLCLIVTIAVSIVSWEFFEEPINRCKKYFDYFRPDLAGPKSPGIISEPI